MSYFVWRSAIFADLSLNLRQTRRKPDDVFMILSNFIYLYLSKVWSRLLGHRICQCWLVGFDALRQRNVSALERSRSSKSFINKEDQKPHAILALTHKRLPWLKCLSSERNLQPVAALTSHFQAASRPMSPSSKSTRLVAPMVRTQPLPAESIATSLSSRIRKTKVIKLWTLYKNIMKKIATKRK